jgi:hypothetical protein
MTPAFRGFSPWYAGSIAIRPVSHRSIMGKGHSGGMLFTSLLSGSQERDRKGPGTKYIFQRHAPSDLLLPTKTHLLAVHSVLNSLIH